jgi:beta-lactamase regulating signal transducer with metallopeptidase domain
MNIFAVLDWWDIAGLTMLHYAWIGALAAVAAILIRRAIAGLAPQVRYVAALLFLAILTLIPVGIAVYLVTQHSDASGVFAAKEREQTGASSEVRQRPEPVSLLADIETPSASAQAAKIDLAGVVRLLPWVWIVGTPITLLFIASGLYGAARLKRGAVLVLDGPIVRAHATSARLLRLSREVAIAISPRVVSPLVIGVFRPVILLPAAAIGGWLPVQLEMILLHELAHVRRWDNLVNLVQRFVEAVLFYQPAVWFVSNWARLEREHCCDAAVLACGKEPQQYAETLASLAMPGISPQYAAAASASHQLVKRIRHILKVEERTMTISRKTLAGITAVLLLSATLVGVYAQQPTAESDKKSDVLTAKGPSQPNDPNRDTLTQANEIDRFILQQLASTGFSDRTDRLREQLENLKRTYLDLTGSVPDEIRALESRLPNSAVVNEVPVTRASDASADSQHRAAEPVKRLEELYTAQLMAAQEALATAKQADPSAAHDEDSKVVKRGLEWLKRHQHGCTAAPTQTNCTSCHQGVRDWKADAKRLKTDAGEGKSATSAAIIDWLTEKKPTGGASDAQSSERDKRLAQLRREIEETEKELALIQEEVELEQARLDKRQQLTNLSLTLQQMRRPEKEQPTAATALQSTLSSLAPLPPSEMSEVQRLRLELDRERSAIAERDEIEKLKRELQALRASRQSGANSIERLLPLGPDGNPLPQTEKPKVKPEH